MNIVVKIGGSIMDDEKAVENMMRDIAELGKENDIVLVHGGGRELNRVAEKLGIGQKWVGAPRKWRVTDKETLELLRMLFCGINAHLLYVLTKAGGRGIGVNGNTSSAILAEKKEYVEFEENGNKKREWIGFTGITKEVDAKLLKLIIDSGYVPIVACLAQGYSDECLNINGDELAGVVAEKMKALLIILSDTPFLMNVNDLKSVVKKMNASEAEGMLNSGKIKEGMVAKLEACVRVAKAGGKAVIVDGGANRPLFNALQGKGTVVEG